MEKKLEVREVITDSLQKPLAVIKERFMRLSLKEKPFQIMPAATDEQIEEHFGSIHKVDKTVEMTPQQKQSC